VLGRSPDSVRPSSIYETVWTKAIHDVACDEATMALLEILAIGNQQVAQGRARPVAEVVKRLRVQFRRTADREG